MNPEKSNEEAQQSRLLGRFWHWYSSCCDRLPDQLFAPKPEPPVLLTREEFKELSEQVQLYTIESDFEREVERIKELSDQRKTFHDETSKTIRRIFYTLVGICLFCVVTLAGTPDIDLLTPRATVTLPVLNYIMGLGAFLVVGPFCLIALTCYLHIFIGQHRSLEVAPRNRQPMLHNFSGWTPRLAVLVFYYWMVPLTLAVFTVKSGPLSVVPLLGYVTFGVTAVMVVLLIRRCPRGWRAWALPLLVVTFVVFQQGVLEITAARKLNLYKADLSEEDLRSINLSDAFLFEADLSRADLSKANLSRANLSGVDLFVADLSEANLSGTNLSGANLSGINLSGANLSGANLYGANLSGANLSGAILSSVDLSVAILSLANVSQSQLDSACGDKDTVLHESLTIKQCPMGQRSATSQKPRISAPATE
jgi:hypothetical protein